MHDRQFDDPELFAPSPTLLIDQVRAIREELRKLREPEVEIAGRRFYVFRPFKGGSGFYDRQVNDDEG